MILAHHCSMIDCVDRSVALRLLTFLKQNPVEEIWTLSTELLRAGRSQADLVLALLRLNEIGSVEVVLGRPITKIATTSALLRRPLGITLSSPAQDLREGGERLVIMRRTGAFLRVMSEIARPNSPYLTNTGRKNILVNSPMYDRLNRIKVGMSADQLRARGVRRRDIFIAEKRGWLKFEEPRS